MKRWGFIGLLSVLILVVVVTGCSTLVGAKSDVTINLGIVANGDPAAVEKRYETLINYLDNELSVDIELHTLDSYDRLIAAMKEQKIDIGLFEAYAYVKAEKEIGAIPLVTESYPETGNGYRSLIVTRKGNGIKSIAEMQGKPFAFVDLSSAAGYLMPNAYFHLLNIHSGQFFSQIEALESHEAVARAVLSGKAAGGTMNELVYRELLQTGKGKAEELSILWKSDLIPGLSIAAHPELDGQLQKELVEAFVHVHTKEPDAVKELGLSKYVRADREMYQAVRNAAYLIDTWYIVK